MPDITNFVSGEDAAESALIDPEKGFCTPKRILIYPVKRFDPNYI
jgi:hypothetical protein